MTHPNEQAGWHKARPQQLPKPCYYPFFMALSLMFFFWGLVSLWLMAVTGFVGMCLSLAGWLRELLSQENSTSAKAQPDAKG